MQNLFHKFYLSLKSYKNSLSTQLILLMTILIIMGTMNIFSSSSIIAIKDYHSPYYFVFSHLKFLVFGLLLCWGLAKMDYHYCQSIRVLLVLAGIILGLLIMVSFIGITVNGSKRWLEIGIRFQPSEMAKGIAMLLGAYGATYVRKHNYQFTWNNLLHDRKNYFKAITPLIILGVYFILVERQPDLGTAAIIFGVGFMQYWVGARLKLWATLKYLLLVISIPVAIIVTFFWTSIAYRVERLAVWWDPWGDALGKGYQTVQSLMAIGSGGIFGLGFGHGYSKFGRLPEAHTDFAVAIWAQEYGFIGILLLGIVLFLMLMVLTKAARRTNDYFGKMLIVGAIILIVGQGIINMAMVCGLLPVVGVPMPFVSYGGTALILNFIILGLVFSVILREEKKAEIARKKRQKEALLAAQAAKREHLRRGLQEDF